MVSKVQPGTYFTNKVGEDGKRIKKTKTSGQKPHPYGKKASTASANPSAATATPTTATPTAATPTAAQGAKASAGTPIFKAGATPSFADVQRGIVAQSDNLAVRYSTGSSSSISMFTDRALAQENFGRHLQQNNWGVPRVSDIKLPEIKLVQDGMYKGKWGVYNNGQLLSVHPDKANAKKYCKIHCEDIAKGKTIPPLENPPAAPKGKATAAVVEEGGKGASIPKKPGFFKRLGTKIKGFFKGNGWKKAGKGALIAAGVIGAVALVASLFKGCKSDNVPPVKDETVPPEKPVVVPPEKDDTVPPEKDDTVPPPSLNDNGTYTVQKKESPYSVAEKLLKEYCEANGIDKNITGYSPEVAKLAHKLGELNGLEFETISEAAAAGRDATKRMPKPMVHPGDIWNIPDLSEYVKKEEEIKTGESLNLAA